MDGPGALEHVKAGLLKSYAAVTGMGFAGGDVVDSSVDIQTRGDLAAKEAISEHFRASGFPIKLYTEELKEPLSFSDHPRYSVVADEIDGTYNLKHGMGMLPHGSIMGIADNPDPRFKDFMASGFLEFNSGNLLYATRDGGFYIIEGWAKGGRAERRLKTSGKKDVNAKDLVVVADIYMLGDLAKPLVPYVARGGGDFRSTAFHLAMVAAGSVDILVLGDNCLRLKKHKTGEELGPAYPMVREGGGVYLDWNGNDMAEERVALHEGRPFHAVVAATEELGHAFIEKMKWMEEIARYKRTLDKKT
jgi:fructose-1,6-bisphosphatase/inositol monophosphatase family enzyme